MGRVRRAAVAMVGLALSVISLVLVASSVDVGAAARILAAVAPGPLVVALAVAFVALALRAPTWQTLVPARADGSRVSLRRLMPIVVVGYLGNLLLPARLGEVLRAYLVSRREGIALGGALGSVALERILDTAALAVMAFAAAAVAGATGWVLQGTGLLAGASVVLLAGLATVGLQPFLAILLRVGHVPIMQAPVQALARRVEPFVHWSGGPHRRRAMVVTIGFCLVTAICNAAMVWFVAQAVGASLSPAGCVLLMAVAALAAAIPAAPANVGTYELAAVTVAASLGVPLDTALALAVLAHVLGLLPIMVGGPLALASLGGGLRNLSAAALDESRVPSEGLEAVAPVASRREA